MKTVLAKITLVSLIILGAWACSTTKIIGSWKDPESSKSFSNIMVVGLTSNFLAQTNVEERMTHYLVSRGGINAQDSRNVFTPDMKITEEMKVKVANKLREQGFDGLLTVALVSIDENTSYVAGTLYQPYAYPGYGNYWGYYGYYSPMVYSPGYYTSNKIYTIEANLYDVSTEKLVWAARSETTDPSSLDKFSKEYSKKVVYQLTEEGMLKNKK